MNFHIMTLFPDMIRQGLETSILGRAKEAGYISIDAVNIRDYTIDKHKKVDDYTYGGGAGMLMQAQPIYDCHKAIVENIRKEKEGANPRVIYVTPQGKVFDQSMAREFAREDDLVFLCGHYEGFDERIKSIVDKEISIGDFVLTGGEIPAMAINDAITRLIPGVIKKESLESETFNDDLVDYPVYTKPVSYRGMNVPEVLLSGHHANIKKYREEERIRLTNLRKE